MKKFIALFFIVLACSTTPTGTNHGDIVSIDTLYRVDTIYKDVSTTKKDTVIVSRVDTIFSTIPVLKVDTLIKVDTVFKKDTILQIWTKIDTIRIRDTINVHDTITKIVRDTISARLIILKDTVTIKVGDTIQLLQGDKLVIPTKVCQ
jgi:hypothetical protein